MAAALLALLALIGHGALGGGLVLAVLVILSLARGLSSIATKDVLGKTIAKRRRGTLMGWSGSIAGAATLIAGGCLSPLWRPSREYCLSHSAKRGRSGGGCSTRCVLRASKRCQAPWKAVKNAWDSIKLGMSLMREDTTFLHFNVARALLLSSALALPYLALLGQQQSGTELGGLGILVVVSGLAAMVASPIWGKKSGPLQPSGHARRGHRHGYVLPAGSSDRLVAGQLDAERAALCGCLRSIGGGSPRRAFGGAKTYLVDIANQDNRALYVALSNTFTGVLMLIVGGMIGALAQWLGSAMLLVILALIALGAMLSAHRLPEAE